MRANELLATLLQQAVAGLGHAWPARAVIEAPKEKKFGDLASNCALVLGKSAGQNPRTLAEQLAEKLRVSSGEIKAAEVAGPGFLNVTFSPAFWQKTILCVEESGDRFGALDAGKGRKAQVEFVSANPTGPLHIGHGRGAAVGDSLVRILRFAGFEVEAEYYINDAGNQMRTLGRSIRLRLLELDGRASGPFPPDCYQGSYITDIARGLLRDNPDLAPLPEDEGVDACCAYGVKVIFEGIRQDLQDFHVRHDVWFS